VRVTGCQLEGRHALHALAVGLTLIGKALRYLPYFVFTFERLGRQGLGRGRVRCALAGVDAASDGQSYPLYAPEDRTLRASDPFERQTVLPAAPEVADTPTSRVRIELLTPARLKFEERLAVELPFHVLVRNLLRRVAHLSYFHCGGDPAAVAFREWIARAQEVRTAGNRLEWFDWERYSGRQQTRMSLGGLLGRVTYEGDLAPFLPLLRLGEVVHVGKATSFGLGRYRLHEG